MFTAKPLKPLSLRQSENYAFGASFDKISSNNDKIYIFKLFRGLKNPPNKFVWLVEKRKFSAYKIYVAKYRPHLKA